MMIQLLGEVKYFQTLDELAEHRANTLNSKSDFKMLKSVLSNIIDSNYEEYVKAVLSIENGIENDNVLSEIYQKYMDSDMTLLNDMFGEFEYDLNHENSFDEMVLNSGDKEVKLASKLEEYLYNINTYDHIDSLQGTREDEVLNIANDLKINGGRETVAGINNLIEEFTGEDEKVVSELNGLKNEISNLGINISFEDKPKETSKKITSAQKDQKLEKRPSILNKLKESKEKMDKQDKKDVVSKSDVEL